MRKLTLAQVKAVAKKNPDGVEIELYPSKVRPNNSWVTGYPVKVEVVDGELFYRDLDDDLAPFSVMLAYFETYNTGFELGKRVHYYLIEELG
jgi:hypothetical protein